MNGQFIEAVFEFEEQLCEQSVAIDQDVPFLQDRRGRVAQISRPVILATIDVDTDSDNLERV